MTEPTVTSRVPNLAWMFAWNLRRRPDETAVEDPQIGTLTFKDLATHAADVTADLRAAHYRPGQDVGLAVTSVGEYLIGLAGIAGAGAVAVIGGAEELTDFPAVVGSSIGTTRRPAGVGAPSVLAHRDNPRSDPWKWEIAATTPTHLQRRAGPSLRGALPAEVSNGAALWAQAAAIREFDLRQGARVTVSSMHDAVRRTDVDLLPTLAAGGSVVVDPQADEAATRRRWRSSPRVVGVLAVETPSGRWAAAADLDLREQSPGQWQTRGNRTVGADSFEWVDVDVDLPSTIMFV